MDERNSTVYGRVEDLVEDLVEARIKVHELKKFIDANLRFKVNNRTGKTVDVFAEIHRMSALLEAAIEGKEKTFRKLKRHMDSQK